MVLVGPSFNLGGHHLLPSLPSPPLGPDFIQRGTGPPGPPLVPGLVRAMVRVRVGIVLRLGVGLGAGFGANLLLTTDCRCTIPGDRGPVTGSRFTTNKVFSTNRLNSIRDIIRDFNRPVPLIPGQPHPLMCLDRHLSTWRLVSPQHSKQTSTARTLWLAPLEIGVDAGRTKLVAAFQTAAVRHPIQTYHAVLFLQSTSSRAF